MRLDARDISELRPVLTEVVQQVLREVQAEQQKYGDQIAFSEAKAAAMIEVKPHVLRDARRRGEIEGVRVGKSIRYTREALDAYLNAQVER